LRAEGSGPAVAALSAVAVPRSVGRGPYAKRSQGCANRQTGPNPLPSEQHRPAHRRRELEQGIGSSMGIVRSSTVRRAGLMAAPALPVAGLAQTAPFSPDLPHAIGEVVRECFLQSPAPLRPVTVTMRQCGKARCRAPRWPTGIPAERSWKTGVYHGRCTDSRAAGHSDTPALRPHHGLLSWIR